MSYNKEDVSKYIKEIMDNIPDDEAASMAEFISLNAIAFGAYNVYEGLGILESTKNSYLKSIDVAYIDLNNDNLRKN